MDLGEIRRVAREIRRRDAEVRTRLEAMRRLNRCLVARAGLFRGRVDGAEGPPRLMSEAPSSRRAG
jgi:hypothetical protein